MKDKIRKTLYVPQWIAEILDSEGDRYDGPGVVAAASIAMFGKLTNKEKMAAMKAYREGEIEKIYGSDKEVKKCTPIREALRRIVAKGLEKSDEPIIISISPSDPEAWDDMRKFVDVMEDIEKKKHHKTA